MSQADKTDRDREAGSQDRQTGRRHSATDSDAERHGRQSNTDISIDSNRDS